MPGTNAIKNGTYLNWFLLIIAIIISLYACSTNPKADFCETTTDSLNGNETPCIDINGYVLGDIEPRANISLYRVSRLHYEYVMKTVRNCKPVQIGKVNEAAGFAFTCLPYGKYVVAIPSTSYQNGFVGSPLPIEFENETVSIDIVYQGGDNDYLVGAFEICPNDSRQGCGEKLNLPG